ncbi:ectoine/hydroxyectoine ABC transporter permease subunit EhuD [Telmatospirillum sp. J64-1]|uniref:ectoine/hydroxyectoine ABC transporter permease subunit EhuD n=1 Tax=Telmatospirillum sp. J64-1 TaxID=2502183 RepID=UPI00115EFAD8|nr:ectoine/hydroxyectoine ABC transporter permease subunit EhuD [Telmatospirillum sp. J64-1]
MIFDWDFAYSILPNLVDAVWVTIAATFWGFLLALGLGLVLALLRRSRFRLISWPVGFVIEFVRSTPLLVQIYFLYFVLPEFGLVMSPFLTGVIALGVHYAAYTSEVYRAGIDGVPKGQWEACVALDLSPYRTMRSVIVPQAIPPVVPALGNYLVAMFKDTPMLSAITVLELLQTAKIIGSQTFRYLEPLTMVGVIFLLLSLVASMMVRLVERRLAPAQSSPLLDYTK